MDAESGDDDKLKCLINYVNKACVRSMVGDSESGAVEQVCESGRSTNEYRSLVVVRRVCSI